jgi:ring-1,2-phenylacetyl-CoA epoxidase subunit PaaC
MQEPGIPYTTSTSEALTSPLVQYVLHLADNALVLGHRNSEWTGHGPVLEQDIAISNIALDLIGQARNFYQYTASLLGDNMNEDKLAFHRNAPEFRNLLMVELEKGDWAFTTLRQFFFSAYQYFLFERLKDSSDETLAAIAAKSIKEVQYHLRWSSEWVIRLGDGTIESKQRIEKALRELAPYLSEFTVSADYENTLTAARIAVDTTSIKNSLEEKIKSILEEATLTLPPTTAISGGKTGRHTDQLKEMLSEMQVLQRTYPDNNW